ncbi:hypothetical protein KSP40_PGU006383 [Platanthera guangdongensis]|uniref:Rab3 GTPase-activating protein catalytic subunit n=1 Tax=Platanthera guangdongensis TaxID=2320717 RepID=A0ABR2LFP2_9ASPA
MNNVYARSLRPVVGHQSEEVGASSSTSQGHGTRSGVLLPKNEKRRGSQGVVESMMLLHSFQNMHAPSIQDAPPMTEDMHEERLQAAEAFGNLLSFSGQLERDILSSVALEVVWKPVTVDEGEMWTNGRRKHQRSKLIREVSAFYHFLEADELINNLKQLCVLFEHIEKLVIMAASIHLKLSDAPRLSDAIFQEYFNFYLPKLGTGLATLCFDKVVPPAHDDPYDEAHDVPPPLEHRARDLTPWEPNPPLRRNLERAYNHRPYPIPDRLLSLRTQYGHENV